MARNLPKTETLQHQEAFEYYYNLGEKRSTPVVARQYHVSQTAVGKWSAAFNWQERVIERDNIIADELARRNITQHTQERQAMLNACRVGINDFIARIDPKYASKLNALGKAEQGKYPVRIQSASDFERISKLYLLLQGEATDRVESIQVEFSSGEGGEDWTIRDGKITKPTNGKGNGAQEAEA